MVVVGIEHEQTPLDVLESVALADADVVKVLASLRERANVEEAVVLATCLRTEVYGVVDRFHEAVDEIHQLLADLSGLPASVVADHAVVRFDDDVATHLFAVAAGLESAVLGEGEVLGQVRRAWERAQEERMSGPVLGELFRHAVQVGKRVRSETGISRGTTSFSHAAVELAEQRRGGLGGLTVAVIGAGEMGAGVVHAMASLPEGRRPAAVLVANRTPSKAQEVAASVPAGSGVSAVGMAGLAQVVESADVLVSAVEAGAHVLGSAELAAGGARRERPLLVVDLGVPRNVDPAAGRLAGVTVLDMDDLRSAVARAMEDRRGEVDRARAILAENTARYRAAARARGAAPVVAALRARLEELRAAELERRRGHLPQLGPAAWDEVDAATRAVLAKLLHQPTVVLKENSGTPRGERLVEALRTLFRL